MSSLSATQIPKPADEQAFERASVILWRCLLRDDNVQRNGRRGQRQHGVDLVGIRHNDPKHLVGVQCKLKGAGQELTAKEVNTEFSRALSFSPPLVEFFITTTSPDDAELQKLARTLVADQEAKGRRIAFYVWGWNTLEERIGEHADAHKAFDPTYGPFADKILGEIAKLSIEMRSEITSSTSIILGRLDGTTPPLVPDDSAGGNAGVDQALHSEIDGYRDLCSDGKPKTALVLLERLQFRLGDNASGLILFRVKANIGSCYLALGEEQRAATLMLEAFEHAPSDPKAAANKMLSLLLSQRWSDAIAFGKEVLATNPDNEWVANYLLQAARHDDAIEDPIALIPTSLHERSLVQLGYATFLRARDQVPDWWNAAKRALAAKPDDLPSQQFCAEADLDEVGRDEGFHRSRALSEEQRT